MKEIFRDIPGYRNYKVSNLGRVKSIDRYVKNKFGICNRFLKGKILSNVLNGWYYVVPLSRDGKVKIFKVHQLVAMAFLNHQPNGFKLVVDHINNKSDDNRLENLQVITQKENILRGNQKRDSNGKFA